MKRADWTPEEYRERATELDLNEIERVLAKLRLISLTRRTVESGLNFNFFF